jgi:hypothetical protein
VHNLVTSHVNHQAELSQADQRHKQDLEAQRERHSQEMTQTEEKHKAELEHKRAMAAIARKAKPAGAK